MKDIEPIHALALSMQVPKLYALLLGSGVSRAANIPTGWEVVLDLVRKLAVLDGGEEPPDPYQWYCDNYGSEPNYSELLQRLAPTPAGRQQLQRQYWETGAEPTEAHRAIAGLVRRGHVKVIVTTNFDRLIENALREAGVEPTVLSSPDDVAGMTPLDHIDYCVLKLHGDYADERIRNTTDELADYPDAVNKLLDRIVDEYGLLVCGWSGDWDVALSNAIRRAPSRRYTTYWAACGGLGDKAKRIVEARDARVIKVQSADQFFRDLSNAVYALAEHAQPHPLSVQAAVAECKRLLASDQHRIELADLIDSLGREVVDELAELPELESFDGPALTARMRHYDETCTKLLAVAFVAAYWSDETQLEVWRNTVERLFGHAKRTGRGPDIVGSSYPAVLLVYALGLGATARGRLDSLGRVLSFPTGRDIEDWRRQSEEGNVADGLNEMMLRYARTKDSLGNLTGMEKRVVPLNDWMFQSLRECTLDLIPMEKRYERNFDRMEVLLALGCGVRGNDVDEEHPWYPVGCFIYRNSTFSATLREVRDSLDAENDDSPFVRFKLAGGRSEVARANLKAFEAFVGRVRQEFRIW